MKATIDGQTYDTEHAKEIGMADNYSQDEFLFRTKDGRFFLWRMTLYLDGAKLPPGKGLDDMAPELFGFDKLEGTYGEESEDAICLRRRRERVKRVDTILPMTRREAMVWCIKTQIPECFRGYFLESI
jgi:hypothetical protein